jgi:hypothetical protein
MRDFQSLSIPDDAKRERQNQGGRRTYPISTQLDVLFPFQRSLQCVLGKGGPFDPHWEFGDAEKNSQLAQFSPVPVRRRLARHQLVKPHAVWAGYSVDTVTSQARLTVIGSLARQKNTPVVLARKLNRFSTLNLGVFPR